jgi:hypothetical protein
VWSQPYRWPSSLSCDDLRACCAKLRTWRVAQLHYSHSRSSSATLRCEFFLLAPPHPSSSRLMTRGRLFVPSCNAGCRVAQRASTLADVRRASPRHCGTSSRWAGAHMCGGYAGTTTPFSPGHSDVPNDPTGHYARGLPMGPQPPYTADLSGGPIDRRHRIGP